MRYKPNLLILMCIVLMYGMASGHDIREYLLGSDVYHHQSELINKSNIPEKEKTVVRAAVDRNYLWDSGPLRVCFGPMDVVQRKPDLVSRIIEVANEWLRNTELKFDFGEPYRACETSVRNQIRVNLDPKYNQFVSILGRASASYSLNGVPGYSMALSFPENASLDSPNYKPQFRFYVLHEFGHALGFVHEHQRIDCNYNEEFLSQLRNPPLSRAFVHEQMSYLRKYDLHAYPMVNGIAVSPTAIGTKYDPDSIMQYNELDPQVYLGGKDNSCFRNRWISALSSQDLQAVNAIYADLSAAGASAAADPALVALSNPAKKLLQQVLALSQ